LTGRGFRFGALASRAESLQHWQDLARKAESLGFATLLIADHFGPQLAPLLAALAAAQATSTLRVGTFVLDNDFRHPAVLAKEAATLDVLTEGRLELGIGAGWNPADYQKSGLPFEPAGVRISKLQEALHLLKQCFAGGTVTFKGQYYEVSELEGLPKPVQRPGPPIMLGANGPRMLRLAAREADILNLPDRPPVGTSTAGNPGLGISFSEQMRIIRETAGPRYASLELSVLCIPRVTDEPDQVIAGLAAQMNTTAQIVADMPATLVGSIDHIVDKLERNRAEWELSYPVFPASMLDALAPVVARLAG
jgi:probable F420-dependent oxidoreductase